MREENSKGKEEITSVGVCVYETKGIKKKNRQRNEKCASRTVYPTSSQR